MDKNDIRAYLHVLGEPMTVPAVLIIGCLVRVERQLEHTHPDIYQLVKDRERVNGQKPHGDPELTRLTNELIPKLKALL